MERKDECGIVYNNNYHAWYVVYKTKDMNKYKVDTKCEIRSDEHGNDCVTDSIIERLIDVTRNGYEYNPYIANVMVDEEEWF